MDMSDVPQMPRAGGFMKILMRIAGVDEETLRRCPRQDWDNVRAVGELMMCTWIYQAALFSMITHRLFATPGQIRPVLILISMFIASFILLIDSYMVMRSGWHLSGIEELKRGGIDVSGGSGARIKAGIFLSIRIFLSIGIAQLTAIFLSIIVFGADVDARIQAGYLQANAHLVPHATALVDDEIQRAQEALTAETAREEALSKQVSTLRQTEINPSSNDPLVQQAQQDLDQLNAQKNAADAEVKTAETFASDELGGIKGDPRNSGLAGNGPRRRAAMERITNAKSHAQQIDSALETARARLDQLLQQSQEAPKQQTGDQLPGFQDALTSEETKLTKAKSELARLTENRDQAIGTFIENAPDHVHPDDGFLAQIRMLEQIAQADNKIMLVIFLIDFTSFGFELASVLAKVTSFVPTTYAALLARDAYLSAVRIVEEMMSQLSELAPSGRLPAEGSSDPESFTPEAPAPHSGLGSIFPPDPGSVQKRPRGRPRKTTLN